jgi:site-specific DNA-methyltransferase (adenine-specific)
MPNDNTPEYGDDGSAARFFYCAKASQKERDMGCDEIEPQKMDESRKDGNPGGDNPRNRGVHERTNSHPTVKPISLMKYLVTLITKEGQVILDPFMGSGSTGIAAKELKRGFVGIELSPEYLEIAKKRIGKS